MSLSSELSRNEFLGNGAANTFPITFQFFKAADLKVIKRLTDGTQVTLTGSDYTISASNLVLPTPLPSGEKIVVIRNMVFTQETEFGNQGDFYPDVVEETIDKVTMLSQQLKEKTARATVLAESTSISFNPAFPADLDQSPGVTIVVNPGANGFQKGPTVGEISNAQNYATQALASKNAAAVSETNAANSATAAAASATAAASSATNSASSATSAGNSATAAATSEADALASKNAAATSESNALAYKNAAQTSATNAANSEANALTYKNAAQTSATNAANSASGAATSATNAAASAVAAAASVAVSLPLAGGTMSGPIGFSNTDFTMVPVGNTAQRPGSPAVGAIRYNTDLQQFEGYRSGAWGAIGGGAIKELSAQSSLADGGTITISALDPRQGGIVAASAGTSATLSSTPFGNISALPGITEVSLYNPYSDRSVFITKNDANDGCIGNFDTIEIAPDLSVKCTIFPSIRRIIVSRGT